MALKNSLKKNVYAFKQTWDELLNLCPIGALVAVVDYRVCYSGQVTHEPLRRPTLGSKEREMEDLVKTSPDKTTESHV